MASEFIQIDKVANVARLTLNRAESHNSFHKKMREDFLEALCHVSDDPDVRIVILTGQGKSFSAGADLTDQDRNIEKQIIEEYKPCLMAIQNMPKICIAAVNGPAVGIGAAFALSCDLICMTEEANFNIAFAGLGLVPDGGVSWQLLRQMGRYRAMEIILGARKISADEALSLGLANRVFPLHNFISYVEEWAHKLSQGAPMSQKFIKMLLQSCAEIDFSTSIDLEAKYQQICIESEDFQEGVTAFFERRSPFFKGK